MAKQKTGTFKRELEVAFSKKSQPVYFRVIKYIVLAAICWIFWDSGYLVWIFVALLIPSLALHIYYRYKTERWTKSYKMWKYH